MRPGPSAGTAPGTAAAAGIEVATDRIVLRPGGTLDVLPGPQRCGLAHAASAVAIDGGGAKAGEATKRRSAARPSFESTTKPCSTPTNRSPGADRRRLFGSARDRMFGPGSVAFESEEPSSQTHGCARR